MWLWQKEPLSNRMPNIVGGSSVAQHSLPSVRSSGRLFNALVNPQVTIADQKIYARRGSMRTTAEIVATQLISSSLLSLACQCYEKGVVNNTTPPSCYVWAPRQQNSSREVCQYLQNVSHILQRGSSRVKAAVIGIPIKPFPPLPNLSSAIHSHTSQAGTSFRLV